MPLSLKEPVGPSNHPRGASTNATSCNRTLGGVLGSHCGRGELGGQLSQAPPLTEVRGGAGMGSPASQGGSPSLVRRLTSPQRLCALCTLCPGRGQGTELHQV